jgi:NAD(P)-dependent dehydrogenase (short-subunit alcohol dehydrogenase family)
MKNTAAIIIGAGDATGGAIARRFAAGGHAVICTRRSLDKLQPLITDIKDAGGDAYGFKSDARDEEQVETLFAQVEAEIAPIEVVVFNIGANVFFPISETTARVYRKVWEMAAFAGFLAGREAARKMEPRGKGTIIFTGATASMRGAAGFSAFAGAKFALRALAQSMARELGPKGIHVAHSIIDGAIDTEWIKTNFPDRYALKDEGGILDPDAIAEAYWQLHIQPKSAWTHELDLRPWMEKF